VTGKKLSLFMLLWSLRGYTHASMGSKKTGIKHHVRGEDWLPDEEDEQLVQDVSKALRRICRDDPKRKAAFRLMHFQEALTNLDIAARELGSGPSGEEVFLGDVKARQVWTMAHVSYAGSLA
jgi:hypothetical protein